jgi:NADPH-dependent 2,4-dienoyl-CoA reductase/sulfur reductase-like enzyme
MTHYDVAIVGAGPAGMATAIETRRAGLSTLVLDEQFSPGGQIYRAIDRPRAERSMASGGDYAAGVSLVRQFSAARADFVPGAVVWNVDPSLVIDYSVDSGTRKASASYLVVASGALERHSPLPGWTLPGVTTVGALQILLKSHAVVQDDVVLLGCGPLIYVLACQMLTEGIPPKAIVETGGFGDIVKALPLLPKALLGRAEMLFKGICLLWRIRKARVPIFRNVRNIRIEGETEANALSFDANDHRVRLETTAVALHQGIIPNQQITRLLRCEHLWNERQLCFAPKVDAFFETTLPNVFAVGDGAGIAGATAAELRGRLVGLRIAERAGKSVSAKEVRRLGSALNRQGAVRQFLDMAYLPSREILLPGDEVVVCRCEEVTAGQIRAAAALGAPGPNQVKSFLRSGMGPCQGRVCGLTVSGIIAAERRENPDDVGYFRIRPPLKPVSLADIAALAEKDAS